MTWGKKSQQPPAPPPRRAPSPGEEFDFGDPHKSSTNNEQPARRRPPSLASVELTAGSAAPTRPASPSHAVEPILPGPRTNSTTAWDILYFFERGAKAQRTKTICRLCMYVSPLCTVMAY